MDAFLCDTTPVGEATAKRVGAIIGACDRIIEVPAEEEEDVRRETLEAVVIAVIDVIDVVVIGGCGGGGVVVIKEEAERVNLLPEEEGRPKDARFNEVEIGGRGCRRR